jgi:hypothetical protein
MKLSQGRLGEQRSSSTRSLVNLDSSGNAETDLGIRSFRRRAAGKVVEIAERLFLFGIGCGETVENAHMGRLKKEIWA